MKKSFTLKAFAFAAAATVAMSATATPSEFLRANNARVATLSNKNVAVEARMQLMNADGKTVSTSTPAKAPAARAEANYGSWSSPADGVYTFTQAVTKTVELNYDWQRRDDNANAGNFQVQVLDFGKGLFANTGSNATFTVTKNADGTYVSSMTEAIDMHANMKADEDGQSYPVYMTTYSNWLVMLRAAGESFSDGEITDDAIAQRAKFNTFDNETGVITIWPVYFLMIDGKASWYALPVDDGTYVLTETYRMIAPQYKNYDFDANFDLAYFSHEKDATVGTFNGVTYNINDTEYAGFMRVQGNKTGTALNNLKQELMEGIMAATTPANIVKVTAKTGTVDLPVDKLKKGQYTILFAYRNASMEEGNFMVGKLNTRLYDEDLEYYNAGTAVFEDNTMYEALPRVFGKGSWEELAETFSKELDLTLPETLSYTVPVQASSVTVGQYRLVYPFSQFYNEFLSSTSLYYTPALDFCVFNADNENKVYVLPSNTGIYFNTANSGYIMMSYGSPQQLEAEAEDAWGVNDKSAITFANGSMAWTQASYDTTTNAVTLKGWAQNCDPAKPMKITGAFCATASAIENVAADAVEANAPVKFYNLQGIEVANPAAGQVVIKVQGSKVSKEIAR